jgi:hypothetical protein
MVDVDYFEYRLPSQHSPRSTVIGLVVFMVLVNQQVSFKQNGTTHHFCLCDWNVMNARESRGAKRRNRKRLGTKTRSAEKCPAQNYIDKHQFSSIFSVEYYETHRIIPHCNIFSLESPYCVEQ